MARLDHPCIVTLFDVGTCDSGPYLVMELLRGKTLAQRIAEGPIPVAEALRIAEEMAKGLAHAHQRGVLHRDLKPANVFLCEDGRVKLLDFGLAHLLGTEGISGAGTPKYMAPEQARGEEVDQRADVYAAGRVLGDMLGERRPRRLERAVAQATSADPAARPRDGQAWMDVLQAARHAVERPARMRRVAVFAGLGVILGGVVVGMLVHRASRPVVTAHGKPSIAVLPFADMSPGKDQEYLSDGVAEEILNALARVPGLWVPGRASSFYFKGKDAKLDDIGRELKVDHVLEGSVRRSGNKVRVSAEVVKVGTGERVWIQSFDREANDIFAIQDEVARAVVEALRGKLMPSRSVRGKAYRPQNQEAYGSFLLGVHLLRNGSSDSNRRALEALEKATEIDPAYPQAWAALANARRTVTCETPASCAEVRRLAAAAADRAVELAPDLPVALAARARSRLGEWNWAGAKVDIDRALELDPDEPAAIHEMAMYELYMGRPRESMAHTKRALEKDPLNGMWWNQLAVAQASLGHFDEADQVLAHALEIDPQNGTVLNNRPNLALLAGRIEEGLAICEARGLRGCMACAYHALGRAAKAQEVLDGMLAEAHTKMNAVTVARVYACRGQVDQAFQWLERARVQQIGFMSEIKNVSWFRALHSDPRWAELLRKMNLPVDGEPARTAAQELPSIAVLPFADMSPKHDQEYFADGVAEEILNGLAQVQGLKVIGRTSSFSFKGKSDDIKAIGQKLGVANLLEGSLRRSGGRLRITAQLVKASDGVHLWSQTFDRPAGDVFAVQDEIARAVVEALRVKLLPGQSMAKEYRTKSQEAYQSYLLGAHFARSFSPDSQLRAIRAFGDAVRRDPRYGAAWASLAKAALRAGVLRALPWEEARSRAREAAGRAVEASPDLAAAYAARAASRNWDWEWEGARADADMAMTLDPNAICPRRGWMKLAMDERVAEVLRCTERDPLDGGRWNQVGANLWYLGQYEKSARAFQRALEVDPTNAFAFANWGKMLVQAGKPAEALERCSHAGPDDWGRQECEALAYQALGQPERAQEAIQAMLDDGGGDRSVQVGLVFACWGRVDEAFSRFEEGVAAHARMLHDALGHPCVQAMRSDGRWAVIRQKMNLPPD